VIDQLLPSSFFTKARRRDVTTRVVSGFSRSVIGASIIAALTLPTPSVAQGRRGGPPPDGPQSPKAAAPIDLTGYWVSIVTEDWRYRMVTPAKGDYQGVPMTADAVKVADAWDPAADQTAGRQCKSYGAAAIMRLPGRLHITWQDDNTLRVDADAGTQTRLFKFGAEGAKGEASWQGSSAARWEVPGRGRGAPPPPGPAPPPDGPQPSPGAAGAPARGSGPANPPRRGSLRVVTTNMLAGYLRKNGVPYSEDAVLTEYFDLAALAGGAQLLVVTSVVDDARYLRQPFIVSTQFRKQSEATGWDPTPCSSTW